MNFYNRYNYKIIDSTAIFDWCNEDLQQRLPCQQRKHIKLPIAFNIPYNDFPTGTDAFPEKITSILKCTYSGGNTQNDYCRQIETVFNITIKPSIRILNFDILSDDR